MDQIQGVPKNKLREKKWLLELLTTIPGIIAAVVAAWLNYSDPTKTKFGIAFAIGAVLLLIGSAWRIFYAYTQDVKEQQIKSFDGLYGAMHVLYSNISSYLKMSEQDPGKLRVTIHRVVYKEKSNDPEKLEQLLPYIGGKGAGAGRDFDIRSGIIGLAARTGEVCIASRQNDDYVAFIKELCKQWNYTPETAKQLSEDRMAWMAVPILNKDNAPLAVVYLDSKERNFFDDHVKKLVGNSCLGIMDYISTKYSLKLMSTTAFNAAMQVPQAEVQINTTSEDKVLVEERIPLKQKGK